MRKMPLLSLIFLVTVLLLFIVTIGLAEISLENQIIPTIINGLVSSISLIVGFNITAITILVSLSQELTQKEKVSYILDAFFVVGSFAMVMCVTYVYLMRAEFQLALKSAMIGLFISFIILCISIFFIVTSKSKRVRVGR